MLVLKADSRIVIDGWEGWGSLRITTAIGAQSSHHQPQSTESTDAFSRDFLLFLVCSAEGRIQMHKASYGHLGPKT